VTRASEDRDGDEGFAVLRKWNATLHDAGYAAIEWPAAYGGRDAGLLEQLVAPSLRARNPERRKAGLEDLQALAEASQELSSLLFWRELRLLAER
jgi:hypothetical protein